MIDKDQIRNDLKKHGYVDIPIKNGTITIEPRPHYCDRGHYYIKAFTDDPTKLYIDAADGFPRYYFDFDCMIKEIELWIEKRKQEVSPGE